MKRGILHGVLYTVTFIVALFIGVAIGMSPEQLQAAAEPEPTVTVTAPGPTVTAPGPTVTVTTSPQPAPTVTVTETVTETQVTTPSACIEALSDADFTMGLLQEGIMLMSEGFGAVGELDTAALDRAVSELEMLQPDVESAYFEYAISAEECRSGTDG